MSSKLPAGSDALHGWVVIAELAPRAAKQVREAAEKAGFETPVRDIKARSSFIRATQALRKRGVITEGTNGLLRDKTVDDEASIRFQFSKRFVEASGATYDSACVVSFDKESGVVTCASKQIKELTEKLIDELQGQCQSSDINSYIRRVIAKADTARISVGLGSYFISQYHRDLVDQLQVFYKALGVAALVLPVNHASGQGESLVTHVVSDLKQNMETLSHEVGKLKTDKTLTKRIANRRMKDLRAQLRQYRELALALQISLGDILSAAGEHASILVQVDKPVDELIAAAQTGQKIDSVLIDLLLAEESISPEQAEKYVAPVTVKETVANTDTPVDLISAGA